MEAGRVLEADRSMTVGRRVPLLEWFERTPTWTLAILRGFSTLRQTLLFSGFYLAYYLAAYTPSTRLLV